MGLAFGGHLTHGYVSTSQANYMRLAHTRWTGRASASTTMRYRSKLWR